MKKQLILAALATLVLSSPAYCMTNNNQRSLVLDTVQESETVDEKVIEVICHDDHHPTTFMGKVKLHIVHPIASISGDYRPIAVKHPLAAARCEKASKICAGMLPIMQVAGIVLLLCL